MPSHQGLEDRPAVAGNSSKSKSAPGLASDAQTPRRAKQPTVPMPFTTEGHPALMYDVSTPTPKGKKRKADGEAAAQVEKRQRRYRPQPPQSFYDVYSRALSQRFYVLARKSVGSADCPEEEIELTGSTGNIYTVRICQKPTCTCPHFKMGNQCKHLLYVMSRVLNAPFHHVYQLALLSDELKEIFSRAPPIPGDSIAAEAGSEKKRRSVEGDCPICFSELDPGSKEAIVWCKAACGQNMHKECFETWATTKRQAGSYAGRGEVTCPMCRTKWEGDEDLVKKVKKSEGKVNSDGYVNVGDQLGVSPVRDTSTYSEWYGRRRNMWSGGGWGYGMSSRRRGF